MWCGETRCIEYFTESRRDDYFLFVTCLICLFPLCGSLNAQGTFYIWESKCKFFKSLLYLFWGVSDESNNALSLPAALFFVCLNDAYVLVKHDPFCSCSLFVQSCGCEDIMKDMQLSGCCCGKRMQLSSTCDLFTRLFFLLANILCETRFSFPASPKNLHESFWLTCIRLSLSLW